jgi:drug/metabolite transporter (DMT)-like permease
LLTGPIERLSGVHAVTDGLSLCNHCNVARSSIAALAPGGLGPENSPWLTAGLAGAVLIGGFALIRRWQQRGGRVRPLLPGRYSPMAGVIVFFALAGLLIWSWTSWDLPWWARQDKKLALFAALGAAAFYLVALGAALLRGLRAQLASA